MTTRHRKAAGGVRAPSDEEIDRLVDLIRENENLSASELLRCREEVRLQLKHAAEAKARRERKADRTSTAPRQPPGVGGGRMSSLLQAPREHLSLLMFGDLFPG